MHRNAVLLFRDTRLELERGRLRQLELRLGPLGVELVAPARVEPPLREAERALLVRRILTRDAELCLQPAEGDVAARHLGRDEELHVFFIGFRRAHECVPSPESAAEPAEEVELPARLHARIPVVVVRPAVGAAGNGREWKALAGVRRHRGHGRREVERCAGADGTRLVHARRRRLHVAVRAERFAHEPDECGVAHRLPEGDGGRRGGARDLVLRGHRTWRGGECRAREYCESHLHAYTTSASAGMATSASSG